jgi:hypothetical protein
MVYNAMFPRNPQPENLNQLMEKFKNVRDIHNFLKAQMVVGAKFALIWLRIYHPKNLSGRSRIGCSFEELGEKDKTLPTYCGCI